MFETQNTKDIEDQILYRDGSCRDINIDDVDLKSASKIINCFYQIYANQRCTNDRGDCLSVSIQNRAIELELSNYPNSLHFVFEDEEKLIKNLQIFMCSDKSKKVFVEVTFFPEDVSCEFTLESFKKFMKPLIERSNTSCYYLRYENASWEYGDTSNGSGVIFFENFQE